MDLSSLLSGVTAQADTQNNDKKALPAGNYNVVIEKVEAKTNSSTGNKGISLQMRVFGKAFNNYVVFDYMALTNSTSPKTLEYSLPKLKKVAMLCGSEDATKWQGKKVVVNLSIDKNDNTRNMNWGFSEYVSDGNEPMNASNGAPIITASDLPF